MFRVNYDAVGAMFGLQLLVWILRDKVNASYCNLLMIFSGRLNTVVSKVYLSLNCLRLSLYIERPNTHRKI